MKGWGPKRSVCPSKPGKSNFLGGISRDFAGISRRCPKSLRKKSLCSSFVPYGKQPIKKRGVKRFLMFRALRSFMWVFFMCCLVGPAQALEVAKTGIDPTPRFASGFDSVFEDLPVVPNPGLGVHPPNGHGPRMPFENQGAQGSADSKRGQRKGATSKTSKKCQDKCPHYSAILAQRTKRGIHKRGIHE